MNRSLTSALLAITLTLGCGGVAVAQAPKPKSLAQSDFSLIPAFSAYGQQNYELALKLFRNLAVSGNATAQYMVGAMHSEGKVVPQNYAEAATWFRLAAKKGDDDGQLALGVMYYKGTGVAQDYKEAVRLYGLAAAQGNATAQNNLGAMYANGNGVAQDYVRAHMWYNLGGASSLSGESGEIPLTNRDNIAKVMTPSQIERAQDMARKCQASNFKRCD